MILSKQLQVQSSTHLLGDVLAWFESLYQPSIPRPVWLGCQTALAEAFMNAVRHAHQGLPPETSVLIEVNLAQNTLEIKVWDEGPGFDLSQKLEQATHIIHEQATSGRGLSIMKAASTTVDYSPCGDGRNCLTLLKKF